MSLIADCLRDLFTANSGDVWNNPDAWSPMGGGFGGSPGFYASYPTSSGETVNEKTALLVSAHFACIRCKSEDLAVMPKEVYEIDADGDKIPRRDHPAFNVLNVQMNDDMTAFKGMETVVAHAIGFKKGVGEIEFDGNGEVAAIWPMDPIRVTKKRIGGRIWHVHRNDQGVEVPIRDENVFELIGPSYDGLTGYSMAEITKFSIGLALAGQKFQSSFFGNGAWLGGIIQKLPQGMKSEERQTLVASFNQRHQSAGKAFQVGVLPGEAEFKEVGVDPEKGQVVPALDFTVDDICRAHRVPPHKVQNYADAHYNNVEHAEIVYRGDSLLPLGTQFEQEAARKLLPPGWVVRFNYNAFQRVDFKTQQEGLAVGRMWGWWTINDCLKKLGESPIDGPHGDMRLIPANMIPVEKAYEVRTQQSTNAEPPKAKPDPGALREAYLPLVMEGLRRSADKEEKRVKYLRGKQGNQEGEVNKFYAEHKMYVAQNVIPTLGSMARVLNGAANAERLQVVGEMYLSEWIAARPAQHGAVDEKWMEGFAARWVDATLTALEIQEKAA